MSKVSVIIPAYNQAHYLADSIRSVLDQTEQDFELIVVDDGSTDNTAEVALGFQDDRLRYIHQKNQGLSAARNTGINHAGSPYLTFLDSDDLFLPEKLTILLHELENNPSLGLVAGQAIPIDEKGRRIGKIFTKPLPEDTSRLLLGNPLHVGSVMIGKLWQERAGLFDESLRSYEDWDMWLRLARMGCKMGWVSKPVSYYRFHTAQMTRDGNQMTTATFAVLDKTYADPHLPQSWRDLQDQAYSQAYMRAAAQAFHAKDYSSAKNYISEAVRLDPTLVDAEGRKLANQFVAWTDLPKVKDAVEFLEHIYANLPSSLDMLRQQSKRNLSQAAAQIGFEAYHSGDLQSARAALQRAIYHRPSWLLNRGVASILIQAYIKAWTGFTIRQNAGNG